ncbi:MAG TPA: citrate/2-methylcitrate synthase [Nannocystaceae bacterium]|nr:citrate/2-methylcitrate synthase [Nannocystaceae bacterium]
MAKTQVHDDERNAWIGAREAVALLGIKRASLYSYASRGWVRSIPGARGRARLYAREDLERLRARHDARAGHASVAAGALRFGEPVLDSRITRIDDDGPHVRGLGLVAAANDGMRFEDVADHVLGTRGAWALTTSRARALATVHTRVAQPADAHPLDLLPAVIAAAGLLPRTQDAWPAIARELVALATATLARDRAKAILGDERSIAARLLDALRGRSDRVAIAAIDAALVVLCEHELNVGTFAVRIAASADAGLHACVVAGLCALGGSRHGRASHRLAAIVDEIDRPDRAQAIVAARLHHGDALPGFGHPLYPRGDPRAQLLLARARALPRPNAALRTVLAVIDAAAELGAEPPNVDSGLVALAAALGMPLADTSSGIFAVARIVGWVAHAIEQRDDGVLLRPRARYVPS